MNTYSIHSAIDGSELINRIELDGVEIESLSSQNDEGFFRANRVNELESLGDVTVYAILH
jgi:hypothetical protein